MKRLTLLLVALFCLGVGEGTGEWRPPSAGSGAGASQLTDLSDVPGPLTAERCLRTNVSGEMVVDSTDCGGGAADGLGPDGPAGDVTIGGSGTTATINAGAVDATKVAADVATQGELDTHEADTSSHGTTGDIVGTTDAQSLSNKTLAGDLAGGGFDITNLGTVETGALDEDGDTFPEFQCDGVTCEVDYNSDGTSDVIFGAGGIDSSKVQQYDIVVDTSGSGDCAATRAALEPINDQTLDNASVLISGTKFEANDYADTGHLYEACFIVGPSNGVDANDFPAISVPGSNVYSENDSFYITTSPGMHLEIDHTTLTDDAVWAQFGDDYRRGRNPGVGGTTGGWGSITNGLQVDFPAMRVTHVGEGTLWAAGKPFGLPFGPAEGCTDANDDASTPGDMSLPQTTGSADGLCDDNWGVKVADASPDDSHWLLFVTGVSHATFFARGGFLEDCDGDEALGSILINRSWAIDWHRAKSWTCAIGVRAYGRQSGSTWYSPDYTNGSTAGMLMSGDPELAHVVPYSQSCALASGTNQCRIDSETDVIGTTIIGGDLEGNGYYQLAAMGGVGLALRGTHLEEDESLWRDLVGVGVGTHSATGVLCTLDGDAAGDCEPMDVSTPMTMTPRHMHSWHIQPMEFSVRALLTNNSDAKAIGFGPGATRPYDDDTSKIGTVKIGGLVQASDPGADDGVDTYFRYHADLLTDMNGLFLDVQDVEIDNPFSRTSLPSYPFILGRSGPGVFHARDFNADVTGTDTDPVAATNRTVLNAAVQAACNWGGGTVHLDAGDYRLAAEFAAGASYGIQVDCDGITIQGEGAATTLLPHNPYDGSYLICVTAGTITDEEDCESSATPIDGFTLRNLRLWDDDLDAHSGEGADPGTDQSSGVVLKNVTNFLITGVISDGLGDETFNVIEESSYGVITRNRILSSPYISTRGGSSGTAVNLKEASHITISNNVIRGGAKGDVGGNPPSGLITCELNLATETGDCHDVIIANNQLIDESGWTCESGTGVTPVCSGGSNPGTACDSDNDLSTCLGGGVCTVTSCDGSWDGGEAGTTCGADGTCSDWLIIDTIVDIYDNQAGDVYDIVIQGNNIVHNSSESYAVDTGQQVGANLPYGIQILDNRIEGAVRVQSTQTLVADNRILGDALDTEAFDVLNGAVTGVQLKGDVYDVTVQNNEITGWPGECVWIDNDATRVDILDNRMSCMSYPEDATYCTAAGLPAPCCTGDGTTGDGLGEPQCNNASASGVFVETGNFDDNAVITVRGNEVIGLGPMNYGIYLGLNGQTEISDNVVRNSENYGIAHGRITRNNRIFPAMGVAGIHVNRTNSIIDGNIVVSTPASACTATYGVPVLGCTTTATKDATYTALAQGIRVRKEEITISNNHFEGSMASGAINLDTGSDYISLTGNQSYGYGGGTGGGNIECGTTPAGDAHDCTAAGAGSNNVANGNVKR